MPTHQKEIAPASWHGCEGGGGPVRGALCGFLSHMFLAPPLVDLRFPCLRTLGCTAGLSMLGWYRSSEKPTLPSDPEI